MRPTRATRWFARAVPVVAIGMAPLGVWRHVHANFETAPLDFRYADRWDGMSFAARVWAASSGGVGPAAVLASGVLLETGLALAAATFAYPARTPRVAARADEGREGVAG